LFPLEVRAKCLNMTTALNWLAHWAIAYATPYMVNEDYANLQSRLFVVRPSVRFAEPVRDGFLKGSKSH
jgi:hypothetical protein